MTAFFAILIFSGASYYIARNRETLMADAPKMWSWLPDWKKGV